MPDANKMPRPPGACPGIPRDEPAGLTLWKGKWQFGDVISMADLKQHILYGFGNSEFHQTFLGAMAFDRFVQIADW